MKVFKQFDNAILPTKGSHFAAGWDLYTPEDFNLSEEYTVDTGIVFEIPEGYFGAVVPRSGLGVKQGITLKNSVGIIDSDYRGTVKVTLVKAKGQLPFDFPWPGYDFKAGDRIAQIIITPYAADITELEEVTSIDALSSTERGDGGHGSTGK